MGNDKEEVGTTLHKGLLSSLVLLQIFIFEEEKSSLCKSTKLLSHDNMELFFFVCPFCQLKLRYRVGRAAKTHTGIQSTSWSTCWSNFTQRIAVFSGAS